MHTSWPNTRSKSALPSRFSALGCMIIRPASILNKDGSLQNGRRGFGGRIWNFRTPPKLVATSAGSTRALRPGLLPAGPSSIEAQRIPAQDYPTSDFPILSPPSSMPNGARNSKEGMRAFSESRPSFLTLSGMAPVDDREPRRRLASGERPRIASTKPLGSLSPSFSGRADRPVPNLPFDTGSCRRSPGSLLRSEDDPTLFCTSTRFDRGRPTGGPTCRRWRCISERSAG